VVNIPPILGCVHHDDGAAGRRKLVQRRRVVPNQQVGPVEHIPEPFDPFDP
jgi:hypothetical protein